MSQNCGVFRFKLMHLRGGDSCEFVLLDLMLEKVKYLLPNCDLMVI